MYRRSLEMEGNNVATNEALCSFFNRVSSLPVVRSAMDTTLGAYNKAKESNALVKLTLTTAEKTMLVAAEHAKPVIDKLETPIVVANNLACKTLDKLEETVPMIKQTPEEITTETKKFYDTTILQPALVKYNAAKTYGVQKAVAAKDYSLSKANMFMDTKYGHVVAGTLDQILLKADGYMDAYLPLAKLDGQPDEPTLNQDVNTAQKVAILSNKIRQRMLSHAVIKVQAAKKRSDEILGNLHVTVDLIQIAKSNLDHTNKVIMERFTQASSKVVQLWDQFNKGNPNEPGEKTFEQKLLFVASQLTNQLHNTYRKIASTLALLPANIQPKVDLIQEYVANLYSQFSKAQSWDDISGVLVSQMRDGIKNLQALCNQLYDGTLNSRPLSWLAPDVDLREVDLAGEIRNEGDFVSFISAVNPNSNDHSSSEEESVELVLRPKWMS